MNAIRRAAKRFGTPLYLYDFEVIEEKVKALRKALGRRFELAYAVKANPSLGILSFLSKLGLSSDVASAGELAAVLRAGFPPSKILSTGPAKTDRDLEALVRAGVSQIHAEGEWELERLERVGRRLKKRIPVGLRLNPPWGIAEKRIIIGGPGAKKFGFDLPSATRVLRDRRRFPHLDICGFQVFNASNVLDAELLVDNTRRVLSLALSLSKKCAVRLRTVDFGGGFGVPYAESEEPLDLGFLRKGLREIAGEARASGLPASTRLVFEPGRFLVAEAGTYVVKVLGTKRSRGVDYVLVDGGVHHFLRPVLLDSPHRVRLVPPRAEGRDGPSSPSKKSLKPLVVSGPLCTSLDILHPRARLPLPVRGDLLVFESAGAYGFTESMPLFLSHEWPVEAGMRKGRLALLRKGPSVSALQRGQKTPF